MTEFIESLPPASVGGGDFGGGPRDEYSAFAEECRAHRYLWGELPKKFTSHNAAGSTRSAIRAGRMKDFRPVQEWECAVRRGVVYVRYIGKDQREQSSHE